jgi:serine/threonine protein kinase
MPDASPHHGTTTVTQPRTGTPASDSALGGLNPLALMDGVLGGRASDWEPPAPESLETCFPGYSGFYFLDRGGMGAVYAANQASLGRRVAFKILPPELLDDEGFSERFKLEAHLLARLQHPHIVAVYDFGVTMEGHHYIVMEYVEGVSLQEILRRDKITTAKALTITAQVCEALHYAHERGVIHRDIKPSNILIDERGLVRVADFGLAKLSSEEENNAAKNHRTRAFVGTLGYAAPEMQMKGVLLDRRSDIFSLGVTLYEMLTGMLPMGVFDPPSKKAGTPAHVDKIVRRALMQKPEERYETAQQMRDAIAASLLRMGTPLVQRAIISKPITSMVTCVIVGMGLIYLIDSLNNQLILEPQARARASQLRTSRQAMPDLPEIQILSDEWAVLNLRRRWEYVTESLEERPGWQFAEIHREEELREVSALLQQHAYTVPIWLAAESPRDDGSPFTWMSGRPMDYQPWIAAASSQSLKITEIQAKNKTSLLVDGESPDWIEVTNTGTTPIDLAGYHLRHYIVEGNQRYLAQEWLEPAKLPSGARRLIQPGERRIILCTANKLEANGYARFNFSLEATAGGLHWCDPRGHVIQRFDTPWRKFPEDTALVLAADGQSWGWTSKPTPGAANSQIEDTFPAPVEGSSDKIGLVLHPAFSGRWTGNPQRYPKPALLRRRNPM